LSNYLIGRLARQALYLIYLPIYLPIYLSIYLSIYVIYLIDCDDAVCVNVKQEQPR